MAFIAVQGSLTLEENTGRKFLALRANVFARTGKIILITAPYGAYRTPAQQQYLRTGWLTYSLTGLGPVFYYAAPEGQSNHQGGNAFDINNWATVGEQVIKEEAAKLHLTRDPSERWHWNNLPGAFYAFSSLSLAGAGVTMIVNYPKALVTEIQELATYLGYPLVIDGVWGKKTENVIRDWQGTHGLVKDGIPGPKTMASLRDAVTKKKAAVAAEAAAKAAAEAAAKLAREAAGMIILIKDNEPQSSGYLVTGGGIIGIGDRAEFKGRDIFELFRRLRDAQRNGTEPVFNQREIAIMNQMFNEANNS